jgi:transcriptional regulator with XRE-family HTH domain
MEATAKRKRVNQFIGVPSLRDIREDVGFSIRELAARSGVSPSTVVRLEAGQHAQPRTRRALAKALGVGVRDLRKPPEEVDDTT